jgi:hypothetical protein
VLASALFDRLQETTRNVAFEALPERCVLDMTNDFQRTVRVFANYSGHGSNKVPLEQLPLLVELPMTPTPQRSATDANAAVDIVVNGLRPGVGQELLLRLDMGALVSSELDVAFTKPLVAGLTVPELRVPIEVKAPAVFLQAEEQNLGKPLAVGGAAPELREALTRAGLRLVTTPSQADVLLRYSASTREGGQANGFYTAYLDLTISAQHARSGQVLHEGAKQGIKGVQLGYPKAGLDAYSKAAAELRQQMVPELCTALFH